MKFRKKPIVIDAEQFFSDQPPPVFGGIQACYYDGKRWYVTTAHGQRTHIVDGDWIIPEPDGRGFYPCKPDIFEATYESATGPGKAVLVPRTVLERMALMPDYGDEMLDEIRSFARGAMDGGDWPDPQIDNWAGDP